MTNMERLVLLKPGRVMDDFNLPRDIHKDPLILLNEKIWSLSIIIHCTEDGSWLDPFIGSMMVFCASGILSSKDLACFWVAWPHIEINLKHFQMACVFFASGIAWVTVPKKRASQKLRKHQVKSAWWKELLEMQRSKFTQIPHSEHFRTVSAKKWSARCFFLRAQTNILPLHPIPPSKFQKQWRRKWEEHLIRIMWNPHEIHMTKKTFQHIPAFDPPGTSCHSIRDYLANRRNATHITRQVTLTEPWSNTSTESLWWLIKPKSNHQTMSIIMVSNITHPSILQCLMFFEILWYT